VLEASSLIQLFGRSQRVGEVEFEQEGVEEIFACVFRTVNVPEAQRKVQSFPLVNIGHSRSSIVVASFPLVVVVLFCV
jgi:hypothetical protein